MKKRLDDPGLSRQVEAALFELERQAQWRELSPGALGELEALRRQLAHLVEPPDGPGRPGWNDRVNLHLVTIADVLTETIFDWNCYFPITPGSAAMPLQELQKAVKDERK